MAKTTTYKATSTAKMAAEGRRYETKTLS